MSSRARKIAFNVFLAIVTGVLLYAYVMYAYGKPTIAWQ